LKTGFFEPALLQFPLVLLALLVLRSELAP
jgi:hypothetical protein